ncbi:MAG: hypothetical protein EXR60_01565 [Dehalococcoidia bacterium]|nr:hypothetical protein [Dehalococcoidia bacterium]
MATYAFIQPIKAGKTQVWKNYVKEMTGPRKDALKASRKKAGLTTERAWLQSTPMGDFVVVYWEAEDIGKVFQHFMTSKDPTDQWFRDKILVEVHGMNPSVPPPPMNELILDFKA